MQEPNVKSVEVALRALLAIAEQACAACVLLIAAIVMYEVVARAVFGAPTIWVQEIAVYLLLATAFLGFAPTLQAGEHIRIDMLSNRFGARVRRALGFTSHIAIAVFAGIAAWGGLEMLLQSLRFGRKSLTLLEIPVWIPQLVIPIGCTLLMLAALHGAWRVAEGADRTNSRA
jgi:TRAP-type C4-dicarboxylate transport system permease small subunit